MKEDKKEVDESIQHVASSRRIHTASVPDFLQTSGVYGAKDTHQELANRLGQRETRGIDGIGINHVNTYKETQVPSQEEIQLNQERSAFLNQHSITQTQTQASNNATVWEDDTDSD